MPSAFARMPSATDLASASRHRTLDCGGLKLEIKLALWEGTHSCSVLLSINHATLPGSPRTRLEVSQQFSLLRSSGGSYIYLSSKSHKNSLSTTLPNRQLESRDELLIDRLQN